MAGVKGGGRCTGHHPAGDGGALMSGIRQWLSDLFGRGEPFSPDEFRADMRNRRRNLMLRAGKTEEEWLDLEASLDLLRNERLL